MKKMMLACVLFLPGCAAAEFAWHAHTPFMMLVDAIDSAGPFPAYPANVVPDTGKDLYCFDGRMTYGPVGACYLPTDVVVRDASPPPAP